MDLFNTLFIKCNIMYCGIKEHRRYLKISDSHSISQTENPLGALGGLELEALSEQLDASL